MARLVDEHQVSEFGELDALGGPTVSRPWCVVWIAKLMASA